MSQAAKSRKKAVEFEQLKQFDKAIAAYMRAIEISQSELGEVDVALFNKVGDLTLRQGRVSDAVTYYERAVDHYVTAGLYNNAIALCNKILRSAPGRSTVYFSLGRICARKGLRGDATRNFLEYASRMQHEGRVDEGMRALAEVADLMPELTEVRRLVEEHAARAGITLPQRKVATPSSVATQNGDAAGAEANKQDLVFLDVDYSAAAMARMLTPPPMSAVEQAQLPPARASSPTRPTSSNGAKSNEARNDTPTPSSAMARSARLEDLFIFDPTAPGADAAFDEDEESVVDGASLIIPAHPRAEELPAPLTGLETTAVADAVPVVASEDVAASKEVRANTLRETPHAVVTFSDAALSSEESVLDSSFIDLENPGALRQVEPTPGLVSAMEFNLPELPAADLQGNTPEFSTDDESRDSIADVTVPEDSTAADVAALHADNETSLADAIDDIAYETADGMADSIVDDITTGELAGSTADDLESRDAHDTDRAIESEIERETEQEQEQEQEIASDVTSEDTPDSSSDISSGSTSIIAATSADADDALFANEAGALLDETHNTVGDAIEMLDTLLPVDTHAAADAEPVAQSEPSHALDDDLRRRETEIFWLEPEARDDSEERDVAASADEVTPESNSVIEFLDIDFGADDKTDETPREHMAPQSIVETDQVTDIDANLDANLDVNLDANRDANIEADIRADIETAGVVVVDTLHTDGIVNDARASELQADDAATPVMPDLEIAATHLATTALPWLDMDSSAAPIADDASVPPLEGVTFDDENFAATLPFAAADTADETESVFVDEVMLDSTLSLDDIDARDANEMAEPVEGFVSDVAAPAETEFSYAGTSTPPFVRTERPAHAEALAPPHRVNQHDLILPGELPPLMLPDECVQAGLGRVIERGRDDVADESMASIEEALAAAAQALDSPVDPIDAIVAAPSVSANHAALAGFDDLDDLGDLFGSTDLPASVAAAEANVVATSRRDELQVALKASPDDWQLRRRLAHALFEVGERELALTELQAALAGLQRAGDLEAACELADELVLVDGDKVLHHQKRVELAIRLRDDNRLRMAYLDLADMLVRGGDEAPARAVYVRVLEIDPWDDRARLALGDAAPPPPQVAHVDDGYVDLADWLKDDDEPASTRMRMREPSVTGNEQADFDSLLRHFKEGVARSLGEEDYESHYDLGVAYKEMGLLDDAVAEFQKALRSRTHRLPAYEALGQCFLEQQSYQVAETVLSRALHEPGLGDEQRVGVLYLLGYACEALQRFGEARSYFERVYATDIHFRDVASRLATLDQLAR